MQVDSFLIYDLRAFARDYEGSALASRITTAANELDRLHELERMSSWRPIETAPHNEQVLLYCPDLGPTNPARVELDYASQGYRTASVSSVSKHSWATHWMPLPTFPQPTCLPAALGPREETGESK